MVNGDLVQVEHELTVFFRRARASSADIAAQIHPDLDTGGYAFLVALDDLSVARRDGVRAVDVGTALHVHKSTMSRSVAQLEGLGLVERVADPADARARLLRITDRGATALQASRTGRRERMADRLADWNDGDLRALARLLRRLNADLTG